MVVVLMNVAGGRWELRRWKLSQFVNNMKMKLSVRLFSTALLLLLVLLAPEIEMVAEARTCESHSHKFKGTCISKRNCAHVCKTEGFHDGHCKGFCRRCFCLQKC